jgi:hypothetical protein
MDEPKYIQEFREYCEKWKPRRVLSYDQTLKAIMSYYDYVLIMVCYNYHKDKIKVKERSNANNNPNKLS